jgi:hypothetical protein
MTKIIFHIGPGKCGSTSIQTSLALSQAGTARFRNPPLDHDLLRKRDPMDDRPARRFAEALRREAQDCDCLVYSHEYCFQRPSVIEEMVRIATDEGAEVVVVGYSRSPSSFIQAAYCQWLFRSPQRTRETWDAVQDLDLDPGLFTGLERTFIAAITTDLRAARQLSGGSIVDWRLGYDDIAARISPLGATLSVGVLPTRGAERSLLEDFYARCGLLEGLPSEFLETGIANRQYDLDLVEATQLAILQGRSTPGPREGNAYFDRATALLADDAAPSGDPLPVLKACVDTMLWPSNRAFAKRYGLDEAAFAPREPITRDQAVAAVFAVHGDRLADPARRDADRARMIARLAGLGYALFRHED